MGWQGYGMCSHCGELFRKRTLSLEEMAEGHSSDVTAPNLSGLHREKGLLPICRVVHVKPRPVNSYQLILHQSTRLR